MKSEANGEGRQGGLYRKEGEEGRREKTVEN